MRIDGERPFRYPGAQYRSVVVLFNVDKAPKTVSFPELRGARLSLHKQQRKSLDAVVQGAAFDPASGSFTIPARTAAVFVE